MSARLRAAAVVLVLGCAYPAIALSKGAHDVRASSVRARQASFPAHLQVTEVEYHLMLSRGVIKAGNVDLQQIDAGMDPHDLRLRRGSGPVIDGRLLGAGQRWSGLVHLGPGVYRLWCSLPEHEKLGMHAVLRVVR